MLRYFRIIRKKLIEHPSKGRTGDNVRKYLLYAIGEILLVVFGILIALQVNNWNEARLNQFKAQNYLIEMVENLASDLVEIDETLLFNHEQDSLLSISIKILVDGSSDIEIASFLAENALQFSTFYTFDINSVAFDNLTATGNIDLLEDQVLRNNLTAYYNQRHNLRLGTQSRVAQVVRTYSDLSIPMILNKQNIQTIMNEENEWPMEVSLGLDQKKLLLGSLNTIRDNMRSQSDQLSEVRSKAVSLIKQVNDQIAL